MRLATFLQSTIGRKGSMHSETSSINHQRPWFAVEDDDPKNNYGEKLRRRKTKADSREPRSDSFRASMELKKTVVLPSSKPARRAVGANVPNEFQTRKPLRVAESYKTYRRLRVIGIQCDGLGSTSRIIPKLGSFFPVLH